MMEFKKILWPTDLSENATQALPYVKSLAEKYQAEVHLLHVVEDVRQFDHIGGNARPSFLKEFQEKVVQRGKHRLEETCQKELVGCPGYQKQIVVGDPAREILKTIEKEDIDLVVMATHGYGEGTGGERTVHFPFGSVSEKVVKNSPVPVFAVSLLKRKK